MRCLKYFIKLQENKWSVNKSSERWKSLRITHCWVVKNMTIHVISTNNFSFNVVYLYKRRAKMLARFHSVKAELLCCKIACGNCLSICTWFDKDQCANQ